MDSMEFFGNQAILGTQLAEVFTIHIKPKIATECGIYGTIYVRDDLGDDILFLYDHGSSNPDYICTGGGGSSLPLISPSRPISAAKRFSLYFDLKDFKGDTEFMNVSYTWDADIPTSYDSCLSINVNGKLGSATIYYTILSVSVKATVSVKLDKEVTGVNFCGFAVARYGKNFNSSDPCHIVLFNKNCEKPLLLEHGDSVPLSRSLLAVPIFSALIIHVDLWQVDINGQKQQVFSGDFSFRPHYWGDETKVADDFPLSVVVKWKNTEISPYLRTSKSPTCEGFMGGTDIVDVSSVRIFVNHGDDMRDPEVHGAFYAGDAWDKMALFAREMADSEPLSLDDTITLTGPSRCISGSNFVFTLSLNDKFQELEICNGYFDLSPMDGWNKFDSRVAAVIEGKNGYAVLHFTVFERAVQASVEVSVCGVNEEIAISGSLTARTGNFEYESDYVRKYYQTMVWTVPEDKPVLLKPECEGQEAKCASKAVLLLHRSAVAVPKYYPLILEANLTHSKGFVRGEVVLSPQPSGEFLAHIGAEDGGIDVKVTWFKDPYYISSAMKLMPTYFPSTPTISSSRDKRRKKKKKKLNEADGKKKHSREFGNLESGSSRESCDMLL